MSELYSVDFANDTPHDMSLGNFVYSDVTFTVTTDDPPRPTMNRGLYLNGNRFRIIPGAGQQFYISEDFQTTLLFMYEDDGALPDELVYLYMVAMNGF